MSTSTVFRSSARVVDLALHALHLGVIVFACVGWLSPQARPAHLALSGAIAASWFVLGPLLGQGLGFCAITGLQHALWRRSGRSTPSYMVWLAERTLRREVDTARVAKVTQWTFYGTSAASVALALLG